MFLHKAMRYYRLWIYSCNLVLLASVAAFVSVAAWTISDFRMPLLRVDLRHPSFLYAYFALALQGGILQAVGCVGALRMNERLLQAYWFLMLLLLLGDVFLGVYWVLSYGPRVSGPLQDRLKSRLASSYGSDYEFQMLWDRLQTDASCCGVKGPEDFFSSEWLQQQHKDPLQQRQQVPHSCCRLQQRERVPGPVNTSCVESDSKRNPDLIHLSGCYDAVHRWLTHSRNVLAVIGYCVIAFLKLCFLGILRYEIREMIQKIRVLRDMSESPGLMDPGGPASLLPGSALAAKVRPRHSKAPPNGNNNESDAAQSSPEKKSTSPV